MEFSKYVLTEKDRNENPGIVYQMETTSFKDVVLCGATFETLKRYGYPILFDYAPTKKDGFTQITIRTNSTEKKERAFLSALFQGLQSSTHNLLEDDGLLNKPVPENEFENIVLERTGQVMDRFLTSVGEEGLQTFREYYSGLRWSTDQERLLGLLFETGTDYDESLLEGNLSRSTMIGVAHRLGIDYSRYRKWYDLEATQVLKANPDIDYRKLRDPDFAQTEEGQQLQRAYTYALGQELAQEYKRYPRTITAEGCELSRPVIPLSKQPIIEALIILNLIPRP